MERFQYQNWETVKEIPVPKNTPGNYSTAVNHLSRENIYRVKYQDKRGRMHYSKEIRYYNPVSWVSPKLSPDNQKVVWERIQDYILMDCCGNKLHEASDTQCNLSRLNPGKYYLFLDNKIYHIKIEKTGEAKLKRMED